MYSSGYAQVSRYSPEARKKMQYRSKSKSCGYYMRIVFFFSSLIQSLIIVSLVLFLIYGKTQDSACEQRIQDLEGSFSRLSLDNVALKKQRKNLTSLLNVTLTEKARNDFDLASLRYYANMSILYIQDYDKKLQQCGYEVLQCKYGSSVPCPVISTNINTCDCGLLTQQLKARLELVESNFTQSVHSMRLEMDQFSKERDSLNLETIHLRREISKKEKQLEICEQTSKNDFTRSLGSVYNVSRAFLRKIESLFPAHIAFQLTCTKQSEHLEQIRSNCTNLSKEVEDKLQLYMNSVGNQVADIQAENNRLKAENWRLSEDYRWCSQNRTGMIEQHRQNLVKLQQKHDQNQERILKEKMILAGDKEVLENSVKFKTKEAEHLMEQMKQLNKTCASKIGFGGFSGSLGSQPAVPNQPRWGSLGGGGSSSTLSGSSSLGQLGRTGSVGGLGASSSSSSSSFGSSFNKPASTGLGATGASSSSSSLPSGSRLGSTGLGVSKPASTLTGGSFPSLGSAGSSPNLSSGGIGSNKPSLSARGSSSLGSSSVSSGSTSSSSSSAAAAAPKSGFGFSWIGNSNSGQSKTGSVPGKGTLPGTSTGVGSPMGAGRTSGLAGVPSSAAQHIQDLQRLINPPGPQEKQDLSRMLG